MTHHDQLETVTRIMSNARIAVLTYVSKEGTLVSTPMGVQDFDHPATTWFLTERSSEKVKALESDPRVNVAYSSDAGWVSLSGTAHVEQNRGKVEELWDASSGAFMSGGPEDPDNIALRIDATTAEYWDSPGKVSAAFQLVKGLVTDSQPDLGENDTIRL